MLFDPYSLLTLAGCYHVRFNAVKTYGNSQGNVPCGRLHHSFADRRDKERVVARKARKATKQEEAEAFVTRVAAFTV
eukprot:3967428-Pyramimonas_sp.AAC.1